MKYFIQGVYIVIDIKGIEFLRYVFVVVLVLVYYLGDVCSIWVVYFIQFVFCKVLLNNIVWDFYRIFVFYREKFGFLEDCFKN